MDERQAVEALDKILDQVGGELFLQAVGSLLKAVGSPSAFHVGEAIIALAEVEW